MIESGRMNRNEREKRKLCFGGVNLCILRRVNINIDRLPKRGKAL